MKRLLAIVLFSVFVLNYSSAYANFKTGNDLVNDMREYYKAEQGDPKTNWTADGSYMGYIEGVIDATEYDSIPSGVKLKQLCYIVANFLEKHPERWNESANVLVCQAIRQAFPK
jgi:hypothetical protein